MKASESPTSLIRKNNSIIKTDSPLRLLGGGFSIFIKYYQGFTVPTISESFSILFSIRNFSIPSHTLIGA